MFVIKVFWTDCGFGYASIWLICFIGLGSLIAVLQAAVVDGGLPDPFSLLQDLLAPPEVDVSGDQVLQALMISAMVVVADEPADLAFEVTGQEVVFEQDAVLQGLVPSLDLALGLGVVGYTTNMVHAPVVQPFSEFISDVTGAIVRQQPWPVPDIDLITT